MITNMSLPMDGHRVLDSRDRCQANPLIPVSAAPRALTANPSAPQYVPVHLMSQSGVARLRPFALL